MVKFMNTLSRWYGVVETAIDIFVEGLRKTGTAQGS
jgi:hypothetical protein